ncbi:hypothetical protein [Gracilibacillus kekensis]|nr:hypothetical protein [Gracilibacillus kekensis]
MSTIKFPVETITSLSSLQRIEGKLNNVDVSKKFMFSYMTAK